LQEEISQENTTQGRVENGRHDFSVLRAAGRQILPEAWRIRSYFPWKIYLTLKLPWEYTRAKLGGAGGPLLSHRDHFGWR
jgi:hypothetical protein